MKHLISISIVIILLTSCKKEVVFVPRNLSSVEIETLYSDSLLSIRAIEILNDKSLAFSANNGAFGLYNPLKDSWMVSKQEYDSLNLHFRAVAHTSTDFFMLSIDNPALLFKTGDDGSMQMVYKEEGEGVFYDAMAFWNDQEGIAIGDSMNGCLSIIITRDAGQTWNKMPCENLPKAEAGEGAFAASNTNIKIIGNNTYLATTKGNIYHSEDKGISWKVIKTPMVQAIETEGIYSIDFYDNLNGFGIGGDYTTPDNNEANKILTHDGGKTWQLVVQNQSPGYRSCVQYIPNRTGKELITVGFKGIDFSNDGGYSWKHLSNEGFYTIRFLNDSIAYAAGNGRISKLIFKE
ncbi:MAG: oxidoreductase [Flavobacteriales bacterium]|nr:oxidoreductase [Flavobacteriia bacterium]NCP05072.1 oxidoreductase [Flavobacteriales bacterium]PIV92605.1 MAG: oxidoreductase [Flavobacteriaceae bacterium CG17_big_fil_post_rev_8_21_14_2_50_33_15]PIY12971.1 MAG: oxidoreductase [Flavobacteriaceae bacterium CG_4_10_14_3_um_filter_33_47]PJB20081.1 MAG: oxidoreductase [Flavobacteriaceae bacterium CG_4_9_14_3_um_filter_33_16]